MVAALGPCYYPGGAQWDVVQARKSARASTMAPYHIEAQGAVTAVRAATLSDRWSHRLQEPENVTPTMEIRSLQRKAKTSGERAALEIVGQPPGKRLEGWVSPSPPSNAGAAVRRQSQRWHQPSDSKSISFDGPAKGTMPRQLVTDEAEDEEDIWGPEEQRENASGDRLAFPNPNLLEPDDELRLLEQHQALVQAELAQSVQRTYQLEEKLRTQQREFSNDLLAPVDSSGQPQLLTRSFAADHPWQIMGKNDNLSQEPPADSWTASNSSPAANSSGRATTHLTLSERFDKGRRFQCPDPKPGLAEAQLNMPASGTGSNGWVEWPLQRGGEAPIYTSLNQHRTVSGACGRGLLPTGLCREIPAGSSAPQAEWWLQQ